MLKKMLGSCCRPNKNQTKAKVRGQLKRIHTVGERSVHIGDQSYRTAIP